MPGAQYTNGVLRRDGGRRGGTAAAGTPADRALRVERAGLSRSVAMRLTGHKTEAVYRRYAITSEADLREGVERLNERQSRPKAATSSW
jgi:hypothetical protein